MTLCDLPTATGRRPPWRRWLLGLALLLALGSSRAGPEVSTLMAPPLRLVANHWEPYTGQGLPYGGVAGRVVQAALLRAGYRSEIAVMPWARALTTAAQGQADGVVAIWSTEERRVALLFSEAYLHNELSLFHRAGLRSVPQSLAELRGYSVGVGRGYDYSDEFLRDQRVQKEPAVAVLPNLLKLARGRVDLVLEDRRIVAYQLSQHGRDYPELQQLQAAPEPLMRLPLHFAISRQRADAAEIIERFNRALEAMRRDGSLEQMLAVPQLAAR